MLPFVIAGLTTGSVYALAAVGLVLTYKTSRLFNFAHGAVATVSAYLFFTLHISHGVPWPVAAAICVLIGGPIMGLILERIARASTSRSVATRVAITIGLFLAIEAATVLIYPPEVLRSVPQYLPTHPFHIGHNVVTADRAIVFIVGAVATAALYLYLRLSRTGVAMRAVVDDPALLDLSGTRPTSTRRRAWVIGTSLASASGILIAPYLPLDATTLTFLVVAAFGAAAVGQFTSLPGAYLGGLIIGVASAVSTKYFTGGVLAGIPSAMPFLVLFVVLLFSPRRFLAETGSSDRSEVAPRLPARRPQLITAALVLVVALLVPTFAGIHLANYSQFLAMTVVFLSLGLLVRTSGQVSLCQVTFMAIGAVAFSHLNVDHHWPWALALLGAIVIVMPIGALLAIPAVRVAGIYLALATFGFGILVQYMFYSSGSMFGNLGSVAVNPPRLTYLGLSGSDKSYYYFCLVVTVVIAVAVVALTHGRLGRLLRGLADSPLGLASTGTSVVTTRVLVFSLSAGAAAIGGVLSAGAIGSASDSNYPPLSSLLYFAAVVIVLGPAPWYALVAAAGFTLVPSYLTAAATAHWIQLFFGVAAVLYGLVPTDLLSGSGRGSAARAAAEAREPNGSVSTGDSQVQEHQRRPASAGDLRLDDVRVVFGGLVAVDKMSATVKTNAIVGLIGPNGAGKTTLFNASSGLVRPRTGSVLLGSSDVTRCNVGRRARQGLGRTYQHMELFDSLSVRENVALGVEGAEAGPNVLRHIAGARGARRRIQQITAEALAECGIAGLADRPVGGLSTGQRRLVELARCLAGPFRIILLDEPSSGLDPIETQEFGRLLKRVVERRALGIFIIEHDLDLVADICDYVYVLDFGKLLVEGEVGEVLASDVTRAAYLGLDSAEADPLMDQSRAGEGAPL